MKIFVTGATGFIGTPLVRELIAAGHTVRGLSRSDAGVDQLKAAGAEPHRGNLTDLDSLRSGATGVDAVVHLAFNHDFSNFAQNGQDEIAAITAIGESLQPGATFVVTSGVALIRGKNGAPSTEQDESEDSPHIPRRPEQTARQFAAKGIHVAVVRLPQVHDTEKQGLIPYFTQVAREKGVFAYVGEGNQRWAAAPVADVAHLYRLAAEQTGPGFTVYHAVQEEGVPAKQIAETIAKGLNIPAVSITPDKVEEHFGWMARFATLDAPASSAWTRKTLNWNPTGPGLIEDLANGKY